MHFAYIRLYPHDPFLYANTLVSVKYDLPIDYPRAFRPGRRERPRASRISTRSIEYACFFYPLRRDLGGLRAMRGFVWLLRFCAPFDPTPDRLGADPDSFRSRDSISPILGAVGRDFLRVTPPPAIAIYLHRITFLTELGPLPYLYASCIFGFPPLVRNAGLVINLHATIYWRSVSSGTPIPRKSGAGGVSISHFRRSGAHPELELITEQTQRITYNARWNVVLKSRFSISPPAPSFPLF